ncbi:MAG: hypothetical protein Q4Q07_06915 [Tissierellia bacterium]|nr:hypothetical protein [Tissierellia bacterium]
MKIQYALSLLPLFIMTLFIIPAIFAGIWVYKDAVAHGENGIIWLLVVILVPNFLGLVLYFLVVRRNPKVQCRNCHQYTSENEPYCGYCGKKIEYFERGKKTKHNIFGYLAIGSFIFLLIGVILFFVLFIPAMEKSEYQYDPYIGEMEVEENIEVPYVRTEEALVVTEGSDTFKLKFESLSGVQSFYVEKEDIEKELTFISQWEKGKINVEIYGRPGGERITYDLNQNGETKILKEELPKGNNLLVEFHCKNARNGEIEASW